MDNFIKHHLKVKDYFRYADDFVFIHTDKKYLTTLIPIIQDFLQIQLGLELHPRKVEIRKFSQGIDFLGYVTLPHYLVLRTKTKKRIFKKLAKKKQELLAGEIEEFSFKQSVQSYLGILKHCEGFKLTNKVKELLHEIKKRLPVWQALF